MHEAAAARSGMCLSAAHRLQRLQYELEYEL